LKRIPDFDQTERSELPNGGIEHTGKGKAGATFYRLSLNREVTEVRLYVSWN
jgi:hypothetical protein